MDFSTVKHLFPFLISNKQNVSVSSFLITIYPKDLASIVDSYVNHLLYWWVQNSPAICICINSYSWSDAFPSASFLKLSFLKLNIDSWFFFNKTNMWNLSPLFFLTPQHFPYLASSWADFWVLLTYSHQFLNTPFISSIDNPGSPCTFSVSALKSVIFPRTKSWLLLLGKGL